ncbi:hypothetical protein [Deinococcus gobiensis]|uniref:Uncharacterized protein n=1 Tax=Deinococcus gobiensis (strain DSM 21396 / JCM 16679 / CGMCC 1.7299 / I-0) TaxID=745776 RepID=H8GTP9_DEIGI|nr:hypothetical protein [Deinococcus gobiensis]AFD25377.1 hypothetical protein DGo_CA1450 [Deinococcus gobiensis I-0]
MNPTVLRVLITLLVLILTGLGLYTLAYAFGLGRRGQGAAQLGLAAAGLLALRATWRLPPAGLCWTQRRWWPWLL